MALNWQWSDKMGSCKMGETVCNIYKGNALMIGVFEDEAEKKYLLLWFAADKDHLKNLLGLGKGESTNYFKEWGITEITLNTAYKDVPWIIQQLAKAKTPITIKLENEA